MSTRSAPLVGIFADDLTGALDAAAPFAAHGFKTVVSTTSEMPVGANTAEVISLNLGTRHMDPAWIADHATSAIEQLAGLGVRVFLNKVDSTLRGNPGVELLAAIGATDADHAFICSAYPSNKRTISEGVLLVDGVPAADTDVGRDQLSPLVSSRVDAIIADSLSRAGLSESSHVRSGDGDVAISDMLPVILTLDASSDDDLDQLSGRLLNSESIALVAGSAGIASSLAAMSSVGMKPRRRQRTTSEAAKDRGRRVLVVTASQRQIVEKQLDVLGSNMPLVQVEFSVGELLDGVSDDSIAEIIEAAQDNGITTVKLGKLGSAGELEQREVRSIAEILVRNLGHTVRKITDSIQPDTVILIGGDTSKGVFEACGVHSLALQGELQPGTVSGTAKDGSIADALLITRAGGFGDENALFDLISLLEFELDV